MQLWFTEHEFSYKNVGLTIRVKEHLLHESTPYQVLDLFDTYHYGKMLTLDGTIQLTEIDEFFYHEMIAHVPMCAHPNPRHVLIIGGGDGGAAREVLVHPEVERVDMAEIDERVIQVSREYLPAVASSFGDARLTVHVTDGIKFVADAPNNTYDVIIVDSSDPVGPAVGLFTVDFYRQCARVLKTPGIIVCQTGSLWFQPDESYQAQLRLASVFEHATRYWSLTPTYPGGHMTYSIGANGLDPRDASAVRDLPEGTPTRYYNREIHAGAFALPSYLRDQKGPRP